MRILHLGLDGAAPELLFGFEDLPNLRRLMDCGAHGRIQSVIPPITEPAIWDLVAAAGMRSIIVGVPAGNLPRPINGISVSCTSTPETSKGVFTHPPELSDEIRKLVGDYPVEVKDLHIDDESWVRDQIFALSRTQFEVVRHLMQNHPWDYFHFVDIGLHLFHHGFWKDYEPYRAVHEHVSPDREVLHDYYRHLDLEIGNVLELLTDETVVLVVSDQGAEHLDEGFGVNRREQDTGPDDCNLAHFGAFILAGHDGPPTGEIHGAQLLDMAPTLLELGGYEIPSSMQGRSLASGTAPQSTRKDDYSPSDEQLVRDRLSGLGYI